MLALPGAHLHSYGKAARPNRKVGHVTVVGADEAERDLRLTAVRQVLADRAPATTVGGPDALDDVITEVPT